MFLVNKIDPIKIILMIILVVWQQPNYSAGILALDTLIVAVSGSPNPAQDINGNTIMNGDFEIEVSGVNTITGDGIDEETHWIFPITFPHDNPSLEIVSAVLTLHLSPMDPGADNDGIWIRGCNCGQLDVGTHDLFQQYTFESEIVGVFSASSILENIRTNGGLRLGYQDDAIVSFAQIILIVESTQLTITEPQTNEHWTAGEKEAISWTGGTAGQLLKIDLSIDSGNTYSQIVSGVAADSGYYLWDIPDTVLSRKSKLMITDVNNVTNTAESEIFKIKGYVLTRLTADGNYERFKPEIHGWKFSNTRDNIWPPSWWSQFDYQGLDPNTNKPYIASWRGWPILATSENFPDWPVFARTFGVDQCYFSTTIPVYNPVAVAVWAFRKGESWHGSCHGFAVTSLAAFEFPDLFRNYFGFPEFSNLFSVELDSLPRLIINQGFTAQFGLAEYAAGFSTWQSPNTTLAEIKEMLLSDDPDKRVLEFSENGVDDFGNGGFAVAGHSVLAYKVEEHPSDDTKEDVYIYDNTAPGDATRKITFLTDAGGWQYNFNFGWDGIRNIYLSAPMSSYLQAPRLLPFNTNNSPENSVKKNSTQNFIIYNSSNSNILIRNSSGDSIGYSSNFLFNTFTNGYPLIPPTSEPSRPLGYVLPANNYEIIIDSSKQTNSYVAFLTDSILMMYGREDAEGTQRDKITIDNNLTYQTKDAKEKTINFRTIIIGASSQKVFDLLNFNVSQNDLVQLSKINNDDLNIKNNGAQKFYDLSLELASATENPKFFSGKINLPLNTSHQIYPDWIDLHIVKIFQDIGNDGIIDDTLFVVNELTGIHDEESLQNPAEYFLAQNYPNPFNPTTKIKYSIPATVKTGHASSLQLKVYDILGREVATLVNKQQQPGNYEVEFNASNLSSGIYFYELKAGNFVQTKKMILIR